MSASETRHSTQVRLVFSGAVQSGEGGGGGAVGALSRGLSFARPADGAGLDTEEERQAGRAADVLDALQAVVEEQTTEITHICRPGRPP